MSVEHDTLFVMPADDIDDTVTVDVSTLLPALIAAVGVATLFNGALAFALGAPLIGGALVCLTVFCFCLAHMVRIALRAWDRDQTAVIGEPALTPDTARPDAPVRPGQLRLPL